VSRTFSTLALLIGCVIGALIPLGEIPTEAQVTSTCHEGDYALIKRSGTEVMIGFTGKTVVLQGQIGATITVSTAHRWSYGFKVFVGNINSTGLMTVNQQMSVPAGGTAVTVNPILGQTFIVIEADCEHPTTVITSRTVNAQGYTTGMRLKWIASCIGPIGLKIGGTVMPSIILSPYNANSVAGILGVIPETYQGQVLLTIPGSNSVPSLPFSVYTGEWSTQYYFGESSDKITGDWVFRYSQFQNLGPYLSPYDWFGMGYTALNQVRGDANYGSGVTTVIHQMVMGNSMDPEILPHNAFSTAFSCI